MPGLQPILMATIANRWLGERVTPLQWGGLVLGLAGVALIMHDRPITGQAGWGWFASVVSLISITLGTLYQRRYCGQIDWRSGNLVQYIAVTAFFTIGAFLFEQRVVHWTAEFVLSTIWLAVVLSIGSFGLLYWLIRHQAATSVASLFYLVPAVTSVMAFVLFDERLDAVAIAGKALRTDADRFARGLDLIRYGALRRLRNLVPVHGAGAGLARHLDHDFRRSALAQHQLSAGLRKACRERPQRLREPPAHCPARGSHGAAIPVEDVEADHAGTCLCRRMKRRVIG